MGFACGIVGLPNVGKSTLFNAITAAGIAAENYPFCTIEPNTGVVAVPDERLDWLGRAFASRKVIPTTIEFVDIAGLVRGASQGEGLGNQFLGHIRTVDAVAHVVRCFEDPNVVHVEGAVNPLRDIETIETELILRDIDTVEKRLDASNRRARTGDKDAALELELVTRLRTHLDTGELAITFQRTASERPLMREFHLLTDKPVMYVANMDETGLVKGNVWIDQIREFASKRGCRVVPVCAKIEAEIAELPLDERGDFLASLGLAEPGLNAIVRTGYELLGLVTFFTAGEKESRAWTVHSGSTAPQAAGVIHTDFERGFIRAEVQSFADIHRLGSEQAVKEAGLYRIEGKEYLVTDGDVMFFRFNV